MVPILGDVERKASRYFIESARKIVRPVYNICRHHRRDLGGGPLWRKIMAVSPYVMIINNIKIKKVIWQRNRWRKLNNRYLVGKLRSWL